MKKILLGLFLTFIGFTGYSQYRTDVVVLPSVSSISTYQGGSKSVFVTDSTNGGVYNLYFGIETANGVTVIAGANGSRWKRMYTAPLPSLVGSIGSLFDSTKLNIYDQSSDLIYSKSWWTSTAGFTATGSPGMSNVDNNIRLTGGTGVFGNYITLDNPIVTSNRIRIEMTFKISNTIAAGHFGLAVGPRSINTWYSPSIAAQYDPIQKQVRIVQVNSTTVLDHDDFSADYTPAQNDIIKITYEQIDNIINCYFENMTQKKYHVLSVKGNLGAIKNLELPNTSKVAVYEMGGQNDIVNLKVSYDQPRLAWITIIGDSKSFGYSAEDNSLTWAYLLRKDGTVGNYAGDGDRTVEAVQIIDSAIARSFKYVIVAVGRNDPASGVASGTWQANLSTIRTKIVNAGKTIIWLLPIPETVLADQSAINNYINATFPSDLKIDPSIGWSNITMLSSDGIHPNQWGHRHVFNAIEGSGYIIEQPNKSYQYDRPIMFGNYLRSDGLNPNTIPISISGYNLTNSPITFAAGVVNSSEPFQVNKIGASTQIIARGANPRVDLVDESTGNLLGLFQGQNSQVNLSSFRPGSKVVITAFTSTNAFYPNGSFELGQDQGLNLVGVSLNATRTDQAVLLNRLNGTQMAALTINNYGLLVSTDNNAMYLRHSSRWNRIVDSAWARVNGFAPFGGTAGQVLTKIDGTDFNFSWQTPAGDANIVANGKTGFTSTTAYGVIIGGTTSTGNLQNAGTGSNGQIFKSNGPSAPGSFANVNDLIINSTYTPSLFASTNVTTVTPSVANYVQLGLVAHVFGEVLITPTATGAIEFRLDLPIATSALSSYEVAGTAATHTEPEVLRINANGSHAQFRATVSTTTTRTYSYHYSFVVLPP